MATPQDSMLAGLFTTPEQYQQQRQAVQRAQAIQMASLDPFQQGQANIQMGINRIADVGAGALGVQDPALKLQSFRQQVLQGVDQTDPESLAQASYALNREGDTAGARQLAQLAQEAALKQSEVTKNMRVGRAAANKVVEANGRQYLIDSVTGKRIADIGAAPTKAGALSPLGKLEAERADIVAQFGEDDPRVKRYDDAIAKATKGKSIGQEIGEAVATSFGMLGKALGPALKKEGEETGQFAAKDFNALGSAVAAGTASKRNLATLETALQNSFTGKFADSKESIITSLTALGVPVGDDLKQAATNKQLVDAMGTRYVFPLVKNFPGSLAAKELDRLEKTAPNSLQQPETIQRLVNLMKVDLAENEYTYNQAKAYKANKQGSLIGFNQADSKIEFQQKLNKLQGMVGTARQKNSITKEEKAAIEALKQELGV
jgi:hypothetical protein